MKIKVFNIRISDEHLENDENHVNAFLEQVEMKKSSTTLVTGAENFWSLIIHYVDKPVDDLQSEPSTSVSEPKKTTEKLTLADLTENEIYILDNLKSWRAQKAEEENIPAYMVLWDQHLMAVAKSKPTTREALLKVNGFSDNRVEKYGADILSIISAF